MENDMSSASTTTSSRKNNETKKLGTLKVGTAGWTNKPSWRGPFFPPRTAVRDELEAYQQHLRAVEINGTCHGMPSESTILNWKRQCGKGFVMSPKMVKTVTHEGVPTRPAALAALRTFCDRVALLGPFLGPILLQFPRTLQLQALHVDQMAAVVAQSALPTDTCRIAVEIRHSTALQDKALLDALKRHGWCLVQHPNSVGRSTVVVEQRTNDNDGKSHNLQPLNATTWRLTAQSWVYVRLHGTNDNHYGCYTEEQLTQQAVPAIVQWMQRGVDVYAYILNDDDESAAMPRNAQMLQRLCYAQSGVPIPRAPKQVASIASFFTPRRRLTTTSSSSSSDKKRDADKSSAVTCSNGNKRPRPLDSSDA